MIIQNKLSSKDLGMEKEVKVVLTVIGLIIALIVVMVGGCNTFYSVKSGNKAVVLTWGEAKSATGAGLHMKIPFAQDIAKVNVQTQKAHAIAIAGTKDMQSVTTEVTVNYHLDEAKVLEIYTKTGLSIEDKIIDPRIQECVKAVTAKYSAEELLKLREQIKSEIAVALVMSVGKYNVIAEDIQITKFDFSPQFTQAIEAKQIAEQSALTEKNNLDKIKIIAEQRVATATAEAEAIKIQAEAITKQGGKEYVQLQWIEAWRSTGGKVPTYVAGANSQFLMNLRSE